MGRRCLLLALLVPACTVGDLPPQGLDAADGPASPASDAATDRFGASDGARPGDDVRADARPEVLAVSDGSGPGADLPGPRADLSAADLPEQRWDGPVDAPARFDGPAPDAAPDVKAAATCSWWRGGRTLSWSKLDALPSTVSGLARNPVTGSLFAGGTGSGVYRSDDHGVTWTPAATGVPSTSAFEGVSALAPCDGAMCVSVASVYASADDGASWKLRGSSPSSSSAGIEQLVACEADARTLFGITYDALMRSDDGGQGWIEVGTGLPSTPSVLAVDPNDGSRVYAGTGGGPSSGQGVWRSTDRGGSFVAANQGMLDFVIGALAVGPDGAVYAAGAAGSFGASNLYRSDDGGNTWKLLGAKAADYGSAAARIVVSRELGAVFVLRSSLAVEVSCDRGETWATLVAGTGASSSPISVPPLLLDRAAGELVLVSGTAAVGAGSSGSGGYRAVVGVELPDGGAAAVDGVVAIADGGTSSDTAGDGVPFCTFWQGGRVSSWQTIDGLPSTVTALLADPAGTDLFAAGAAGRVFKSTDQGTTWGTASTGLPSGTVASLVACGVSPTTLCASVGGDIYASRDGGAGWTLRSGNTTSSSAGLSYLFSFPGDTSTVLGLVWGTLMRSDDGGQGWVATGTGLPDGATWLAAEPGATAVVYAGTSFGYGSGQGVWKSTDRGTTFTAANSGMLDLDVTALVVAAGGTVYAGSDSKLLRSSDGGASWADLTSALPPAGYPGGVVHMTAGPSGSLFVLRGSGQVEVSCDGGQRWRSVVAGVGTLSNGVRESVLLAVGDAKQVVLLTGSRDVGARRVVVK